MCQGSWVDTSESAQMDLQVGGPVLEHLVSPGVTILLTSQNTPGPRSELLCGPLVPPPSQVRRGASELS